MRNPRIALTIIVISSCFLDPTFAEEPKRKIENLQWVVTCADSRTELKEICRADNNLLESGRHQITAGTKLLVKADYEIVGECDGAVMVQVEEKQRDLRVVSDLKDLVDSFKAQANADGKRSCSAVAEHILKEDRATVTIRVRQGETELAADSFLTGPQERWYLSLDLPVRNTDSLKYDNTTGQLSPKENPQRFYVGLNYMPWGDVLTDDAPEWRQQISLKLMAQASSKPLNSFGLGIGYTFSHDDIAGITRLIKKVDKDGKADAYKGLSPFTLFAGHFWTKEDSMVNGVVRENDKYKGDWQIGLSFSISAAKGWLK